MNNGKSSNSCGRMNFVWLPGIGARRSKLEGNSRLFTGFGRWPAFWNGQVGSGDQVWAKGRAKARVGVLLKSRLGRDHVWTERPGVRKEWASVKEITSFGLEERAKD